MGRFLFGKQHDLYGIFLCKVRILCFYFDPTHEKAKEREMRESEQWKNSERKRDRERERAGRVVPLGMTHCDDSLKQLSLCSAVIFD